MQQAPLLARQYDSIVANPPYLGSKYYMRPAEEVYSENYPGTKSDLFSAFIERNCCLTHENGHDGFMTPFDWMFLKSYEPLRKMLVESKATIIS